MMTQQYLSIALQPYQHLRDLPQIRVGFLPAYGRRDQAHWTNLCTQMQQALRQKGLEIVPLGDPQKSFIRSHHRDHQSSIASTLDISQSDSLAEQLDFMVEVHRQLEQTPCDILFAPRATAAIALLASNVPVVYLSDSTVQLAQQQDEQYLTRRALTWADQQERFAIARSDLIIYLCEAAMHSAVKAYGADPRKLRVIPLLDNLEQSDSHWSWQQWAEEVHYLFLMLLNYVCRHYT